MNNTIDKNESETIKFKKVQIEKCKKDNNCKSYKEIAIIVYNRKYKRTFK